MAMNRDRIQRERSRISGVATGKVVLTIVVCVLLYIIFAWLSEHVSLPFLGGSAERTSDRSESPENGSEDPPENETAESKEPDEPPPDSDSRQRPTPVPSDDDSPAPPVRPSVSAPPPAGSPEARRQADEQREKRIAALEVGVRSLKADLGRTDRDVEQVDRKLDGLERETKRMHLALERETKRMHLALEREMKRMNLALETMERRVFEHRETIARLDRDIRQPGARIDMRNPVVLHPAKIYRNAPMRLFDGQVLFHLVGFRKDPPVNPGDIPVFRGADFEITLPLLDILVLNEVGVGDRRVFRYADRDFFLELLGTDEENWARVAITRKLPE
jgi:hypothetical protein